MKPVKPSDLYETPTEVFDYWNSIFQFNIDVCAEPQTAKCSMFFTAADDALKKSWHDANFYGKKTNAWMNPPYSQPHLWVAKAKEEQKNNVLTVALLPGDTSTKWFQSIYHDPSVTVVLPPGRIRFLYKKKRCGSPKFGNAIAIFWPIETEKK